MAQVFLKSFTCPHCHTKCSFVGRGVRDNLVLRCTGCEKGVFFQLQSTYYLPEEDEEFITISAIAVTDYYPKREITVDPSIPKDIADDYQEAARCHDAIAPKATVTMCRRALQNACVEKGAKPKADLIDQVDELEAKRTISPAMNNVAHTVRMIGNWGAHPQNDPLKDVTLDDASQILEFAYQFLDEMYVRPAKLDELKKKKGIK